jgi:hypothetical protein
MVDGILEDVVERVVVLVLGFDHLRPEPLPEDVVLSAMALVEGPGVLAVQVPHPVRQVRERRFDEQVVVVAEQAAGVEPPPIPAPDPPEDLEEHRAVPVVQEDRRVVVPLRADVVVRPRGEITVRTSHPGDRSAGQRLGMPF